jgi:hypothetical protein
LFYLTFNPAAALQCASQLSNSGLTDGECQAGSRNNIAAAATVTPEGKRNNFVRRIPSFDKQALSTCKGTIHQVGLPDRSQLQATQDTFFTTSAWPGAKAPIPKLIERGIGKAGECELNLGRHIADLQTK